MSSVLDPIILFVTFIIFALVVVLSFFIFSSISDSDLISASLKAQGESFYGAIVNMSLFIVLAIIGGTIGSAYLIRTDPIFFIVAVVLLFIQLIILPELVNVFNSIVQSSTFTSIIDDVELLVWLVQLAPIFSVVGAGLAVVVGVVAQ